MVVMEFHQTLLALLLQEVVVAVVAGEIHLVLADLVVVGKVKATQALLPLELQILVVAVVVGIVLVLQPAVKLAVLVL
jgi:hypothetical protein